MTPIQYSLSGHKVNYLRLTLLASSLVVLLGLVRPVLDARLRRVGDEAFGQVGGNAAVDLARLFQVRGQESNLHTKTGSTQVDARWPLFCSTLLRMSLQTAFVKSIA